MFEGVGKEGLLAGLGIGLLLLCAPVVAVGVVGAWWWTREPALAQARTYAFSLPPEATTAGGIDGLALHRELWPGVVLARDPVARRAAAGAVLAGVATDEGLRIVAEQLLVAAETDARTAFDAAEVWNAALAARGVPFALQAGGAPPNTYLKGYWLAAVPTVRVGDRATSVRVGLRVDRLNVVEGWLGIAEDVGGAIVVVDRVRDFAVEELWPRLDPTDERPLSASLRADLAARLPPQDFAALSRTAPAQRSLRAAVVAVEGRRHGCGSGFRLSLPWDGNDELAGLRRFVEGGECPAITDDEVDAINGGTLALRAEPALPAALEALVGLAARHVAVHEARHRLDHEDWGFGTPPPCVACEGLSDRATSEAAAYLAALSSGEGTVALVQGCQVVSAAGGGSAATALQRVYDAVGASCEEAVPTDLAARAAAVSASWFGATSGEWQVDGLPPTLPLGL